MAKRPLKASNTGKLKSPYAHARGPAPDRFKYPSTGAGQPKRYRYPTSRPSSTGGRNL